VASTGSVIDAIKAIKTCRLCLQEKPETDFHKAPRSKGARTVAACIQCTNAKRRSRYKEHAAEIISRVSASYRKDPSKQQARSDRWYQANKHLQLQRQREKYLADPQAVIRKTDEWARSHPEAAKAIKRRYRQRHPDKKRDEWNRRRAIKLGLTEHFTREQFNGLCARYGNRCLACGSTKKKLTADHVVPLSVGGSDDISNIQPLCLSCNASKHTRVIDYRPSVVRQECA
jgi:hypothetical protein